MKRRILQHLLIPTAIAAFLAVAVAQGADCVHGENCPPGST